jgi:hypothetical protein
VVHLVATIIISVVTKKLRHGKDMNLFNATQREVAELGFEHQMSESYVFPHAGHVK